MVIECLATRHPQHTSISIIDVICSPTVNSAAAHLKVKKAVGTWIRIQLITMTKGIQLHGQGSISLGYSMHVFHGQGQVDTRFRIPAACLV